MMFMRGSAAVAVLSDNQVVRERDALVAFHNVVSRTASFRLIIQPGGHVTPTVFCCSTRLSYAPDGTVGFEPTPHRSTITIELRPARALSSKRRRKSQRAPSREGFVSSQLTGSLER